MDRESRSSMLRKSLSSRTNSLLPLQPPRPFRHWYYFHKFFIFKAQRCAELIRYSLFFSNSLFFRVLLIPDYQFPIDVSGVAKDHPFLEADSLQSLFRRLHALNRCANMKLDTHHHSHHHSTNHDKSVSTNIFLSLTFFRSWNIMKSKNGCSGSEQKWTHIFRASSFEFKRGKLCRNLC